jgi:putative glutamine amidotransferase
LASQRPVIGIPTQTLQAIEGIPAGLPPSWVMNQRYYLAATSVGAVPWMIPLLEDIPTLREIYNRLDGVLLAGGVDMDPGTYQEEKSPLCGVVDPPRDLVEMQLAKWAHAEGKPIFGICRGLQVLNVVLGGSLFQDVTAECSTSIKHDYVPTEGWSRDHLAHEVTVKSGSRLHASPGHRPAGIGTLGGCRGTRRIDRSDRSARREIPRRGAVASGGDVGGTRCSTSVSIRTGVRGVEA